MGDVIRLRNKSVSSWKRRKNRLNKGDDIEDPYFLGKKKFWSWTCKKCGEKMEPYKEDEYGDIVLSCTNPGCILNKIFANGPGVQMAKLLKQQQQNSRLYYRGYSGGYY